MIVQEGQSNVNIHAMNLKIRSIQLEGQSLAWGYNEPSFNPLPQTWKINKVKDTSADLAKLAFLQYKHLRECSTRPNLCIKLPMVVESVPSKEVTLIV